eukprot:3152668-Rhodomonas_salina.1
MLEVDRNPPHARCRTPPESNEVPTRQFHSVSVTVVWSRMHDSRSAVVLRRDANAEKAHGDVRH